MLSSLEDSYLLRVSEDACEAYLTILQNDQRISLLEIQRTLLKHKVIFGISLDTVKDVLKSQLYDQEILIAAAKSPSESKSASLEYLISDTIEKSPQVADDGHTDFKNIKIVKQVEKGTALIRKHPKLLGEEGRNVYNEVIPPEEPEDIAIVLGENTIISEIDENLCIAACDGYITKNSNGSFSVKPILKISEDVDFSTGNIDFKGSVFINGNVKSGFSVNASNDVVINGVIEDATIEAGGNIECKKGITGRGQGKITAGKDIRIGYIESQTVVAQGNVFAKHEIINSNVQAGNSILCEKGKIIGGTLTAGSRIDAHEIGNKEGTHTEVFVGANSFIIEKMMECETGIKELEEREKEVSQKIMELAMKKVDAKKFTAEMEQELNNLKKEKDLLPRWMEEKKNEISNFEYELEGLMQSKISVRGTLYTNVKCTISDKTSITKEEHRSVVLSFADDQIKIDKKR